ncbi:MAG TPA: hypothetical protein VJ487_10930 [Alphaproteobacteria bacterium]|nr:hypothetical protein [Alphaproteobacteria bacterium]
MPQTEDFKQAVVKRVKRDPPSAKTLLGETATLAPDAAQVWS